LESGSNNKVAVPKGSIGTVLLNPGNDERSIMVDFPDGLVRNQTHWFYEVVDLEVIEEIDLTQHQ
jgi:hypothetical protein